MKIVFETLAVLMIMINVKKMDVLLLTQKLVRISMNAETESNSKLNPVPKELFLIIPANNASGLNLFRYFSAQYAARRCIFSFSAERSSTLIWHLQGNLTKSIQRVFGSVNWKTIQR